MKKFLSLLFAFAIIMSAIGTVAEMEFKTFPAEFPNAVTDCDPTAYTKTMYPGAYRAEVTVGDAIRTVVIYTAEDYAQTQGFVMVAPDSSMTAEQVLVDGGWKAIADEYGLMVTIMETADGIDADFFKAALAKSTENKYVGKLAKGRMYAVGYGDSVATTLTSVEDRLPATWSGVTLFGDINVNVEDIPNAGKYELPVWMFVDTLDDETALVDLFKATNGCTDEVFSNANADIIYFPNQLTNDLLLNDQPMSQVRVTIAENSAALNAENSKVAYEFMRMGTREVGYNDMAMRYARDLSDWGATSESIVVDGITRFWIQYIPNTLRETVDGKVPLVIAAHGSSLSGEYFAERTQLIRLAEERGFIVVFPTGSLRSSDVLAGWNTNIDGTLSNDRWDDFKFLREMIDTISAAQPVDTSRIYMYGHSNGGMFTESAVYYLDGVFAAAIGTGCCTTGVPQIQNQYETPIFIAMGKNEGYADIYANDGKALAWAEIFTAFNNCDAEMDGAFRTGRFDIHVWENDAHVPMVQFGCVSEMPHTATLDLLGYMLDWAFQFNRNADGTVGYRTGIYNP